MSPIKRHTDHHIRRSRCSDHARNLLVETGILDVGDNLLHEITCLSGDSTRLHEITRIQTLIALVVMARLNHLYIFTELERKLNRLSLSIAGKNKNSIRSKMA